MRTAQQLLKANTRPSLTSCHAVAATPPAPHLIYLRMCRLVVLRLVLEKVGARLGIRNRLVLLYTVARTLVCSTTTRQLLRRRP